MISENFLEELKQKVSILDVASSYVKLSHRGRNWVGLCPFHAEKTASFNVYPESNSFYCFGCGEGGDLISFVEKIENLSYLESLKFIANIAGINIDLTGPELEKEKKEADKKRRVLQINREAAKFFYKELWCDSFGAENARLHLKKRNFSKKTLTHFGIGYSPNDRTALIKYLLKLGYAAEEIVAANLAYNSYGKLSSRFAGRVMFPIIDQKGNVIAFGGRSLDPNTKPKYLNTSDTLVFKKSMHLFSLNFAKKERSESLLLVEGYMDAVALHQSGFKNTVATLGTSLTDYQARLISTIAREVVICYDSDQAGEKATEKASVLLRREGIKVKVAHVPKGKDPEEFLRISGKDASIKFKKILNNSKNDVEYKLIREFERIDTETAEGKIAYLDRAVKVLSDLNNKLEQEVYASKISRITGVNKSTILDQVERRMKKIRKSFRFKQMKKISLSLEKEEMSVKKSGAESLRTSKAEGAIIAYIVNNPEGANNIFSRLPVECFCSEINRKIYSVIHKRLELGKDLSFQSLSADLEQEDKARVAKYLACENLRNSSLEDVNGYIKTVLYEKEKHKVSDLCNVSDDEIINYINKLRQLKR